MRHAGELLIVFFLSAGCYAVGWGMGSADTVSKYDEVREKLLSVGYKCDWLDKSYIKRPDGQWDLRHPWEIGK